MEIKARLKKPYTEQEKVDFIMYYGQNCMDENPCCYEIEETETELQALGYTEDELAESRKELFLSQFFKLPEMIFNDNSIFPSGYYRKIPKGYSSAIESLMTVNGVVDKIEHLPANVLIFYQEPDFYKPEECTEEWLINHQFKNNQMTKEEFAYFFVQFVNAWNEQEH